MTRNKLSARREQSLCCSQCHSSTMPKAGILRRRIPNQFEFCFCVLIGVAVGPSGLAGQRLSRFTPTPFPEINARPALIVLPAGTANAVFLYIFHISSRNCYNNGYAIPRSQLQPGDLIFWSKTTCDCGRLNEIHHVGVYVGAGKIVDASSAKGYVVLRDLWSNSIWQIVLYARPQG